MADASHLERMGRELNCPICLSLLNSAASLTCNHVFCNSCIEKSMKSASYCPVCKVPYRRREIRHAPHMDNLVSVYRSMEVSSGVNIFDTQTAASTKISGEDKQTGPSIYGFQDKNKPQLKTVDCENQKLCKKRESKRPLMTNQGDFDSRTVKPSFPTKKRVQVPLYPNSETQRQPAMLEGGLGENNHQENSLRERNKPVMSEKGELVFSPFFWLREEEDVEKSSQHTFEDQVTSTPPDAPSFSDIKDSDDEVPCKTSPKSGTCILSNGADFLDSEMFDWTQRPCSPELCSSPLEIQIADTTEHTGPQEKAEAATLMDGTASSKIRGRKRKGVSNTSAGGKAIHNKVQKSMANERVSNATKTRQSKRNKKSMHEEGEYIESQKLTDQDLLEKSGNINKPLNASGIPCKNKQICSDVFVQEKESEEVLALSSEMEPLVKGYKTAFDDFLVSKHHPKSSQLEKNGKSSKITEKPVGQLQKFVGKVRAQKVKTDKDIIKDSQCDKVLISNAHANFEPLGYDKEVAGQGKTSKTYEENSNKKLKSLKEVKFSKCVSKKNCSIISLSDHEEEGVRDNDHEEETVRDQNFEETKNYQLGMEATAEMDKALGTSNWTPLQKCKMLSNKVQCSFCQSSEETEASGTLVKYLNGKLIADSQNTRSKVVHVHKNCGEWAPNVYFEGNIIVNLETELTRSQRIRCSCCGIKGAALGCYQKTCRKSFHVPCARLTPECRWDYENFVMLCPLHVSCQLPNEEPESQTKQKRKVSTKSQSNLRLDIINKCESSMILHWKSEKKYKNLVICCSALNNVEKGIVSEFVKKSGVTILKNWDLSVTHVIASTDENGACRRTLKFLMGVLEGKWILSIEWIKACIKAKELVEEQHHEIAVDIHGIRDGPRLGRLRLLDKQPKLFDGCTFYFMGGFVPSYKGYLHDLAIVAGGKILSRKPVAGDQAIVTSRSLVKTFIIYSLELPENCRSDKGNSILNRRLGDAKDLASSTGAIAASNSWILNSIAGHEMQNLG